MNWVVAGLVASATCLLSAVCGGEDARAPDYATGVRPLLRTRCAPCHGALRARGGLRLDTAAGALAGGRSGPAVVPGNARGSLVIRAVRGTAEGLERMPKDAEPLEPQAIALLEAWIEAGARAPAAEEEAASSAPHWAFLPPVKHPVPVPRDPAWREHPIDAFIEAAREERGLAARGPAPKPVILRRLYLDLAGLPPAAEELRAFLADDSDDAYEKVADRLLASPRHGERWARHWMDVWRYSDWYGYQNELRNSARHIWRWRSWIIESLDRDAGYDRMVVEMLAADEAAPADRDALRATGFLARNYYKFNRNVWLDSTIEHTSKAFLGITLNCARCHDHMFDPIGQEEYYRFRALFEPYRIRTDRVPGAADTEKDGLARVYDADLDAKTFVFLRGNEKKPLEDQAMAPAVPQALDREGIEVEPVELPAEAYYPGLAAHVQEEALAAAREDVAKKQAALEEAREPPSGAGRDALERVAEKALAAAEAELSFAEARIAADRARYGGAPASEAEALARAAAECWSRSRVLAAVAEVARLEQVAAGARQAVAADEKAAKTLADEEKRLDAARKTLAGAEEAARDPGVEYPSLTPLYPPRSSGRRLALARWIASAKNPLAARVAVNHIWMRHFGEPLVPTVFDFGRHGKPPTHPELLDWLAADFMEHGWRMKRLHKLIVTSRTYRTTSERDASPESTANARLDPDNRYLWRMNSRRMEGEAVRDSLLQAAGALDTAMGGPDLDEATDQTTFRRSIYYRHAPEKQSELLAIFDGASPIECYRRPETVVPQQALSLANSPLAIAMARRLQARIAASAGSDVEFVDLAFEHLLSRRPGPEERALCLEFLEEQGRRLSRAESLTPFAPAGDPPVPPSTDPRERAREDLVHVLINHHEFITIR